MVSHSMDRMTRILFVENRYRTALWEIIAQHFLREHDVEIHWIVQNHGFEPSIGAVHLLPYPSGRLRKEKRYDKDIEKVIASNRAINYFGVDDDSFIFEYKDSIDIILSAVKPDLAIGECTQAHELLTSQWMKRHDKPYIHPSSCRYPVSSFSFYEYDTLSPFCTNPNAKLKKAASIVQAIASRNAKPTYMLALYQLSTKEILLDKTKLTWNYIKGERFNTPNPFIKRNLSEYSKIRRAAWEEKALSKPLPFGQGLKICFPLHMQPEANVDVWGYPFNNQLKVIEMIATSLPNEAIAYIKPNPKSKYELSEELLTFIESRENIQHLSHSSSMDHVFDNVDAFVTITGTVAIECLMSSKPVAVLGGLFPDTKPGKGYQQIKNGEELKSFFNAVIVNEVELYDKQDKIDFITNRMKNAFEGVLGDGLQSQQWLKSDQNMKQVFQSFDTLLEVLES